MSCKPSGTGVLMTTEFHIQFPQSMFIFHRYCDAADSSDPPLESFNNRVTSHNYRAMPFGMRVRDTAGCGCVFYWVNLKRRTAFTFTLTLRSGLIMIRTFIIIIYVPLKETPAINATRENFVLAHRL